MGFFDSLFRSGYHVRINGNTFKQDAFVSSLVAFFAAVALPFSFCTLFYMALPQTLRIEEEAMYYLLCSVMGLAMVIMVIMMSCRSCHEWVVPPQYIRPNNDVIPGNPVEDNPQGSRINRYFQKHVTIIGMGIFFVLGLVDDVSNVISGVMCFSYYIGCPYPDLVKYFITNKFPFTMFSLIRPLFLGTIFVFCIKFHGKRLKKCAKVRYSLAVVLLAAVSVWLHANLREMDEHSHEKFRASNPISGNNGGINSDVTVAPSCIGPEVKECLAGKSPIQNFIKSIFSFIYPLHIEMTFLVIELLAHLTSLLTIPEHHNEDGNWQNPDLLEHAPLLDNHPNDFNIQAERRNRGGCFDICHCLFIIVVSIIGVIHVLMALFTRWDTQSHDPTQLSQPSFKFRFLYNNEQIFFYSLICLALLVSFLLSSNFSSVYRVPKQHKYDGLELMFLLSSFAMFFVFFLQAIAYYYCIKGTQISITNNTSYNLQESFAHHIPKLPPYEYNVTSFLANIIDHVAIFPLTILVLQAGRIQPLHETSNRARAFKLSLLVLSILNFANWFSFGFIESGNQHIDPTVDYYFYTPSGSSVWESIKYVVSPISLFYRFTAAILLLKIYLK